MILDSASADLLVHQGESRPALLSVTDSVNWLRSHSFLCSGVSNSRCCVWAQDSRNTWVRSCRVGDRISWGCRGTSDAG